MVATVASQSTQDAVANGDTRTITILHEHTKETAAITFRRQGSYDQEALRQLNWLLRDWRLDEPTKMDPRLFDIVWQVYREVGAREPIHVVSAYRAPETNAALRRRSRAVAEHSQHMLGKAMDFYIPDVSMARVREIGMRIQNGGVGFYPNAYNPFVHLDAGSVRSWPRMPGAQLARLFPDGRTVHMPREGKPMPGYEEAKAQILARGGSVAGYATYAEADDGMPRKSLWATLFGGGDDEDQEYYRAQPARRAGTKVAAYAPAGDDAGTRSAFFPSADASRRVASPQAAAAAVQGVPPGLESLVAPEPAASPIPLPPRRPRDVAQVALAGLLPPERRLASLPEATARPVGVRGEMRPGLAPGPVADERLALRTLFEAVATRSVPTQLAAVETSRTRVAPLAPGPRMATIADQVSKVRTVFSAANLDQPGSESFSGPAVAPLPLLR